LVLVIERKGTAVLRSLIEWKDDPLRWPWKTVISSGVIDQIPDEILAGRKILVFDDMTRSGRHIKDLLEKLEKRGLWKPGSPNLRLAVFAAHADSSEGIPYCGDQRIPFVWFYRYLTSEDYEHVRNQIIRMLQAAGSLMLDTEHIEVRIRLNGNFNQFVTALRRRAKVVVFRSRNQLTNITVFYEEDEVHRLPHELFPPGTDFKNIVKKCRILQVNPDVDEYSVMPIGFPSIPAGVENWPNDPRTLKLLGKACGTDDVSRFYAAGLIAALEILRWALKDLGVLDDSAYTLNLPVEPSTEYGTRSYSIEHLRVMYPTLDITGLNDTVAALAKAAHSEGKQLRSYKHQPKKLSLYEDNELRANALSLLQIIRQELDRRMLLEGIPEKGDYPHPFGLTLKEIFKIAKEGRLPWADERISTLFDILIDEGLLVTHVERLQEDGVSRVSRTFEPDGEVVSSYVRRYTTQWGLPYGF
jgi:hypothetical protein